MTHPSFPPIGPARWEPKTRSLIVDGRDSSEYDTPLFVALAQHEPLLRNWYRFTGQLVTRTALTPRERELLLLRTAWRTATPLQWGEHVGGGLRAGLTEDEISSLAGEEISAGWDARERTVVEVVDELCETGAVGEGLLAALDEHFTAQEVLEVLFLAGNAAMIGAVINTLGITQDFTGLRDLGTLPLSARPR